MDVKTADSSTRIWRAFTPLGALGVVLLVLWGGWWVESLRRDRLVGSERTWVPALPFLSSDFKVSLDHVARVRAAGLDPYAADWICLRYPYPPLVTWSFAWVTPLSTPTAAVVWTAGLFAIFAGGTLTACSVRRRLGLVPIPYSTALAAVLFSSPVILALERGQCDALVVPLLALGAWLLGRNSSRADWGGGAVFALAAWVKYYPGIALLGLFAFRRWRAVAGFAVAAFAVGLADPTGVLRALANARYASPPGVPRWPSDILTFSHSLSAYWRPLWVGTPLNGLGRIPGMVAAAALLLPFLGWVSFRVARSEDATRLAFPLTLWLVAAGTFLPPAAGDYNLIFLPLAIIAVWDARDRPAVHMLMALVLLALQPFAFTVSGRILLLCKVAGIVATGLSLTRRAGELTPVAPSPKFLFHPRSFRLQSAEIVLRDRHRSLNGV